MPRVCLPVVLVPFVGGASVPPPRVYDLGLVGRLTPMLPELQSRVVLFVILHNHTVDVILFFAFVSGDDDFDVIFVERSLGGRVLPPGTRCGP